MPRYDSEEAYRSCRYQVRSVAGKLISETRNLILRGDNSIYFLWLVQMFEGEGKC